MESPEAFLRKFLAARSAVFRRHQEELESFQKEFCQGPLIYDKRLTDHEEERILDVVQQGTKAEVTTNGNIKRRNQGRLRYELTASDGTWLISDWCWECPICHGTGKFRCSGPACDAQVVSGESASDICRVCKGLGWISAKKTVEGFLEE